MTYIIRGDISRPEAPLQNLPSSSSSSYPPGSFRSQADNVCHYRLHNGLRLHAQICALSCGNSLRVLPRAQGFAGLGMGGGAGR